MPAIKPPPRYLRDIDCRALQQAMDGLGTPQLRFLKVKLTSRCNLRCEKCNYWRRADRRETPDLPIRSVRDALADAAGLGCVRVKFSGGEVMLYDGLAELVSSANALGSETSITTNGTRVTKARVDELQRAGLSHISISLDNIDERTQDIAAGVEGAGRATLAAIRAVLGADPPRTQAIPKLTIGIVIHSRSEGNIARTLEALAEMGVRSVALISLIRWHLSDSSEAVAADKAAREALDLGLTTATTLGMQVDCRWPRTDDGASAASPHEFYATSPCFVPWYHLYLNTSGVVSPCCYLKKVNLGCLQDAPLHHIFLSTRATEFRKNSLPPIQREICRMCPHEVRNNSWLAAQLKKYRVVEQ